LEPETSPEPIVIPYSELSPDVLRGVVESFVLREGTDYGEHVFSLEQKLADVMRQLERGEARIVFDPQTETVHLVTSQQLPGEKVRRP